MINAATQACKILHLTSSKWGEIHWRFSGAAMTIFKSHKQQNKCWLCSLLNEISHFKCDKWPHAVVYLPGGGDSTTGGTWSWWITGGLNKLGVYLVCQRSVRSAGGSTPRSRSVRLPTELHCSVSQEELRLRSHTHFPYPYCRWDCSDWREEDETHTRACNRSQVIYIRRVRVMRSSRGAAK